MREEKQFLLDDLKQGISRSDSFFILRHKLTANQSTEFRSNLLKVGGEFEVASKRMVIKAAADCGYTLNRADLQGHVALIYIEKEPTEVAKYAISCGETFADGIELIGGVLEGKPFALKDVERIKQLPTKKEAQAQLLSVLQAPLSDLLAVMHAIQGSIVYCLDEKVKADENKLAS